MALWEYGTRPYLNSHHPVSEPTDPSGCVLLAPNWQPGPERTRGSICPRMPSQGSASWVPPSAQLLHHMCFYAVSSATFKVTRFGICCTSAAVLDTCHVAALMSCTVSGNTRPWRSPHVIDYIQGAQPWLLPLGKAGRRSRCIRSIVRATAKSRTSRQSGGLPRCKKRMSSA